MPRNKITDTYTGLVVDMLGASGNSGAAIIAHLGMIRVVVKNLMTAIDCPARIAYRIAREVCLTASLASSFSFHDIFLAKSRYTSLS